MRQTRDRSSIQRLCRRVGLQAAALENRDALAAIQELTRDCEPGSPGSDDAQIAFDAMAIGERSRINECQLESLRLVRWLLAMQAVV